MHEDIVGRSRRHIDVDASCTREDVVGRSRRHDRSHSGYRKGHCLRGVGHVAFCVIDDRLLQDKVSVDDRAGFRASFRDLFFRTQGILRGSFLSLGAPLREQKCSLKGCHDICHVRSVTCSLHASGKKKININS